MKAINPNTHKLEPCTLLKNYVVEGRDWVRFDDGRMEPLANVEAAEGTEWPPEFLDRRTLDELRREYDNDQSV